MIYSHQDIAESMARIHFTLHQVRNGIFQNPQTVLKNELSELRTILKASQRPKEISRCIFLISFLYEIKAELENFETHKTMTLFELLESNLDNLDGTVAYVDLEPNPAEVDYWPFDEDDPDPKWSGKLFLHVVRGKTYELRQDDLKNSELMEKKVGRVMFRVGSHTISLLGLSC
jgi:hypothetical protein